MSKVTPKSAANFRLVMLILGSVFIGLSFGWSVGAATFCLLPILTSAIKKSGVTPNE